MPFDPVSLGVAGAGMIFDFFKNQQAQATARENVAAQNRALDFQKQNLTNALYEARTGRAGGMRTAGGLRTDQFGNATYYDPNQNRWITSFSPLQQDIIRGGQERQRRAQTRGTQAAQDYDRLRSEYLFRRPKSEAESYSEIVNLLNQAMGTGERQLDTLMNRFGVRTAGNVPQITQMDRGPTPGQQLAETMLKARGSALEESLKREAGHGSRYLPALKQFEETANYMAPVDPTGSAIVGMAQQGIQDLLKTGSEYDKLIANLAVSGGRNVLSANQLVSGAYGASGKAQEGGPGASDFLSIAKMLMPTPEKGGPTALGKGARAGDGSVATYKGPMDALANQMSYGVTRGYGGNRSYLTPSTTSRLEGGEPSPIGLGAPGAYGETGDDIPAPTYWGQGGAVPSYGGVTLGAPGADWSGGYYRNPYSAWQF